MNTITLVLGIRATQDIHLEKLDLKIKFLNSALKEDICMALLKSFLLIGNENIMCKFKKGLYGLKQAPR